MKTNLFRINHSTAHDDVIEVLIKAAANPNTVEKDGETPLHYVSYYGMDN